MERDAIVRDFTAACLKAVAPLVKRLHKAEATVDALRRVLGEPTRTFPSPQKTRKSKTNGITPPGRGHKRMITWNGETRSLGQWAAAMKTTKRRIRQLHEAGKPLDTPSQRSRREAPTKPARKPAGEDDKASNEPHLVPGGKGRAVLVRWRGETRTMSEWRHLLGYSETKQIRLRLDRGVALDAKLPRGNPGGRARLIEWNGERHSLNGWCRRLGYPDGATDMIKLRLARGLPLDAELDSHGKVDGEPTARALHRRELGSSGPPAPKLDPLFAPMPDGELLALTADSIVEGRRVRDWARERDLLVERVLARLRGGQPLATALGPTVPIESQLRDEDLYSCAGRY